MSEPSAGTESTEREMLERYRGFANLAADWYWELDAELRYIHHEGRLATIDVMQHDELLGLERPTQIERDLGPTEAVLEHNRLLTDRQPVNTVLSRHGARGVRQHVRVLAEPRFASDGAFQGYRGCGRDVTDVVELRERYVMLARKDDLTGLLNRREFRRRLESAFATVCEDAEKTWSICLIDLDRFKLVNDTAGHAAGDLLLQQLSRIMTRFIGPSETLARFGGDEFAMLLESDPKGARLRMELLIEAIADHEFLWEERPYSVGASIGISRLDSAAASLQTCVDQADSACYAAKDDGRNRCIVFTADSPDYIRHREELAQIEVIREALRVNRFRLLMQEIEPSRGPAGIPHHEILLRLESATGELLAPSTFIPIAERFMIMQEIDLWVVEHCLDAIARFQANGSELALSINLSGTTLSDRGCLEKLVDRVENMTVDPSLLCFEITETAAIRNASAVIQFMNVMQARGIRFALDDFGAGLSSFSYIRSLPIDYLKIDGYFIRNIRSDDTNRAITAAFIQLSRELGIATVAESVEDKATRRAVAEMGIDYVQGYGVSRPVEVDVALSSSASRVSRNRSRSRSFESL